MVTCSVISALKAKARKNSCSMSKSKLDTRVRATGTLNTRNGRPERSTEAWASASSIRTERVALSNAPALVAQGLPQRLAQHDADVFHRVVDVHLHVTGGLDGQVHQAVLGPCLQHVAEERDRRLDLRAAGAVDVELDGDLRLLGLALERGRPRGTPHRFPSSPPIRISAARAWASSPSTRASAPRCGSAAARPDAEYSSTLERFTKSSVSSGDANRAVPAVGSTWLGPAT